MGDSSELLHCLGRLGHAGVRRRDAGQRLDTLEVCLDNGELGHVQAEKASPADDDVGVGVCDGEVVANQESLVLEQQVVQGGVLLLQARQQERLDLVRGWAEQRMARGVQL